MRAWALGVRNYAYFKQYTNYSGPVIVLSDDDNEVVITVDNSAEVMCVQEFLSSFLPFFAAECLDICNFVAVTDNYRTLKTDC